MKYVILDLDNVISDDAWRIPRIKQDEPDLFKKYHDYHLLAGFDNFKNQHLVNIIESRGHKIIISTGRSEHYRAITEKWLDVYCICPVKIYMRPEEDTRSSSEIKMAHYTKLILTSVSRHDIACVYDDNPNVITMYKLLGIPTQPISINDFKLYKGAND